MQASIYIGISSGYPRKADRKYGYVLEYVRNGDTYTREGFGETCATYHGACLQAVIEALGRFRKDCEITLYTEDPYVAKSMEKDLATWAGNGFTTKKGKPVADQELWSQLWPLYEKYTIKGIPGRHSYSSWLRGEFAKEEHDV